MPLCARAPGNKNVTNPRQSLSLVEWVPFAVPREKSRAPVEIRTYV